MQIRLCNAMQQLSVHERNSSPWDGGGTRIKLDASYQAEIGNSFWRITFLLLTLQSLKVLPGDSTTTTSVPKYCVDPPRPLVPTPIISMLYDILVSEINNPHLFIFCSSISKYITRRLDKLWVIFRYLSVDVRVE